MNWLLKEPHKAVLPLTDLILQVLCLKLNGDKKLFSPPEEVLQPLCL